MHPDQAQHLIREGAEQAVKNLASMKPYTLSNGATVEVEFDHQSKADAADLMIVFQAVLTAAASQR